LIEALYLNHRFKEKIAGDQKSTIEENANHSDRQLNKIKRRAHQEFQAGRSEAEILADLAKERVRCPLLSAQNLCELYECRPLTCRFYGIPTAIAGEGHTCGLSGFKPGETYPTVNLDAITARLQEISAELVRDLKTRFVKLADMLVPVSTALISTYDEVYLGLKETPVEDPPTSRRKK
jgi:Fe-S-cluster containining protein